MTKAIGYIPDEPRDITQELYMKLFEDGKYGIIREIRFKPTKEKVKCDDNFLEKIIIREDYHILDRILKYTGYDGYIRTLYLLAQYCKKDKYEEYMDIFHWLKDDHFDNAMEAINYDTVITDYINNIKENETYYFNDKSNRNYLL